MVPLFKSVLILSVLLIIFTGNALAVEYPSFFKGVRPLGMGGAFTAVADDENAMFYNPAGFNKVEGSGGLAILNPLIEISENSSKVFKEAKDTDFENTSETADFLRDRIGEHQHGRVALFPNVYFHNFGIGLFGSVTVDAEIRDRQSPKVDLDIALDVGLLVSGARGFLEDSRLKVGLTGKLINREALDKTYSVADITSGFEPDDDLESGSGFGVDLGLIYSFKDVFMSPSIGVAIQNIGDIDLIDKAGLTNGAGTIKQQVNIGVSLESKFWIFDTILAFDFVDITRDYVDKNELDDDDDLPKRLHMGAEIKLPAVLTLRAGINQGYGTAGATINFWIIKLDLATYAEEIGAYAGQRPDRRTVAQLSLGW